MAKNSENEPKRYWIIFIMLGAILVVGLILAAATGEDDTGYNTAIIPITGELTTTGSSSWDSSIANSAEIIEMIDEAENDPAIKAVIFEINSPGGSPVATDEISERIKRLHEKNITTVAWIRESGASGAYWIATSTGHIVANRMSYVGSIGVIGSYLEWYGLMKDYNVTYRRLVAGEYKDSGTPFRPLSSSEESMIQEELDTLHEIFIEEVSKNRNMSIEDVRKLATGQIYLGKIGKEKNLVDELGGKREAVLYIERQTNETVITKEFFVQRGLFDALFLAMNQNSYAVGKGIGSGIIKSSTSTIRT